MSMRAAPFFCPYCGEEDLEPVGEEHGRFHCGSCDRTFILRFIGSGLKDDDLGSSS